MNMRTGPALVAAIALLAGVTARGTRAEAPSPALKRLLGLTGGWVERFAEDSTFIVGEERYEQEYRVRDGSSWRTERRVVLSEIVLVKTQEEDARRGYPWVQFRDAIEVDGNSLPDHRGRLERLFAEVSGSSYARARALIQESARLNLGPFVREINVPSFALFFLHPRNQARLRFELKGETTIGGAQAAVLAFRERERPTMIRSPGREDRPARGTVWVDPATGAVLKTDLEVDADRHWVTDTEVAYRFEHGVDAWVPATMGEHHHRGSDEFIDCTARYSNYRRFVTSARMIVPK